MSGIRKFHLPSTRASIFGEGNVPKSNALPYVYPVMSFTVQNGILSQLIASNEFFLRGGGHINENGTVTGNTNGEITIVFRTLLGAS